MIYRDLSINCGLFLHLRHLLLHLLKPSEQRKAGESLDLGIRRREVIVRHGAVGNLVSELEPGSAESCKKVLEKPASDTDLAPQLILMTYFLRPLRKHYEWRKGDLRPRPAQRTTSSTGDTGEGVYKPRAVRMTLLNCLPLPCWPHTMPQLSETMAVETAR